MLEKLESLYKRYKEIAHQMTEPDVMSDMKRYIKLNKDYKDLTPVIDTYKEYARVIEDINSTKEMLSVEKDDEFKKIKIQVVEYLEQIFHNIV